MEWVRKEGREKLNIKEKNGVVWMEFPALSETRMVSHGFSTRLGGVSEGKFASMNFTFTRGDNPEHVMENYRRMAEVLGEDLNRMVLSWQTHTTNVRVVTEQDAGKGIFRERDYQNVDGLVTNVPGMTLVTFYADCVPLFFVDPVHRAIGLSHSGWRGTVNKMGKVTVELMQKEYGTDPSQVVAAIGPSICRDCYEVSEDVIEEFRAGFDEALWPDLFCRKENGKYQLDLWRANQAVLAEAGVCKENTAVTNLCTHCNPEILFSHRSTGTARGNLSAFLALV